MANPGWRQSNLSGNTLQESYKARLARQVGTVPKFQGYVLCPVQRISFDGFFVAVADQLCSCGLAVVSCFTFVLDVYRPATVKLRALG